MTDHKKQLESLKTEYDMLKCTCVRLLSLMILLTDSMFYDDSKRSDGEDDHTRHP